MEDDGVLAGLEHELEVAADDRLLGPPAVDDAPLLADERDRLVVDLRAACRRPWPRRAPRAARGERLLVPRYEQRARFRDPRPRRNLDDGADGAGAGARRAPGAAPRAGGCGPRRPAASSSSCCPAGAVSSTSSSAELEHGRRQVGEPRRERDPDPRRRRRSARAASACAARSRRRRVAPRARPCGRSGRAAPAGRAPSRRARRARDGASARCRPPPGTRASRPPRRAVCGHAPARPPRLSPGPRRAGRPAPIVRRRRRPGARQAVPASGRRAPPAPRSARRSSGSSVSGSGARKRGSSSSRTTIVCPGGATDAAASAANRRSAAPIRASQARADRGERAPERRLEPAVEPLDSARLEVDDAGRPPARPRSPASSSRAQDLLPRLLGRRRVRLDERELRAGRERLAQPHPRPHPGASAAAVTGPTSGSPCGSRRERRGPQRKRRRASQRRPKLECRGWRRRRSREHMFYTNTCSPVKTTNGSLRCRCCATILRPSVALPPSSPSSSQPGPAR